MPFNALIPILMPGQYPNSLLIIVCQGPRPDCNEGSSGLVESRAFGMDVAVSYRPGRDQAASTDVRRVSRVSSRRGVRRLDRSRAVLAPDRKRTTRSQPLTNASTSFARGSRHVGARLGCDTIHRRRLRPHRTSRRCFGRSAAPSSGRWASCSFWDRSMRISMSAVAAGLLASTTTRDILDIFDQIAA